MSGREKLKASDFPYMFWIGVLCVAFTAIPYAILGTDSLVTYHDQLDGELIAYILQARHLFDGGFLEEFMGGMPGTALVPPAPFCVLLFLGDHPFAAYICMMMMGKFVGYIGMYLLSFRFTGRRWIGTLMGLLFACIPFLPVYGLSQFGIPLLVWCFLDMREGNRRAVSFFYVVFFALNSSLVLVGFAVLGLWIAAILCNVIMNHTKRSESAEASAGSLRLLTAWLLLLMIYILENLPLLGQMFFSAGEVSHKEEYVLSARPFLSDLTDLFLNNAEHSVDYHRFLLPLIAISFILVISERTGEKKTLSYKISRNFPEGLMFAALCIIAASYLSAALWNCGAVTKLRSHLGSLGAFQADRVIWLTTVFWYLLAAVSLGIISDCISGMRVRTSEPGPDWPGKISGGIRGIVCILGVISAICSVGICGFCNVYDGDLRKNIQKLINPDYGAMSYSDYYALGVMDQVMDYLTVTTGEDPDEYRVVSLGIDPAAAYYAGFYCLDGYSNNYSLEYKHAFRTILAPELDESDYLRQYFDEWGNRAYLLSSEVYGYYTVERGGYFWNYRIDAQALYDMGGRYVISAVYLVDSEEQGLYLMEETPFATADSYYCIYLYEVAP